MDDARSDADCMAAAAAGDRRAFETVARRYQQRLIRYAARSLRFSDAQDVVQDVLVKAFVNANRYNPRWPLATWLFAMTQRTSIDCLRSERRRTVLNLAATLAPVHSPAATAESRDLHGRLWTIATERLSADQAQAMWLHYVEDLSTRDVARVMGRSWVWVKTALHRGRKTLAPHVRHLHDADALTPARLNEVIA